MYQYQKSILAEKSCKYEIYKKGNPLSYHGFLDLLQQDEHFRSYFINVLSDIPFHAYQWETPQLSLSSADQPFEFVATKNSRIDLPPDPGPFREYFNSTKEDIAVFDNLGRDAKLIAPAPSDRQLNYSHLGIFTELAPMKHQQALWNAVGRVTKEQVSEEPLWLNTAGGGVTWLHVRLDSRPKYYKHRPYISGVS